MQHDGLYIGVILSHPSEIQSEGDQRSTHSAFASSLLKRTKRLPFAMSRLSASRLFLRMISNTTIQDPGYELI